MQYPHGRAIEWFVHRLAERTGQNLIVQTFPSEALGNEPQMFDAVMLGSAVVTRARPDEVWVTWGDQVGVLPLTANRLAAAMATEPRPAGALPVVTRRDPYIHFDRDDHGRLIAVRQRREGDAMPEIGEGDMGLFALRRHAFERELPMYAASVGRGSGTGERNFVPFIPWLAQRARVVTFPCVDAREAVGVNTRDELRAMEAWLKSRRA